MGAQQHESEAILMHTGQELGLLYYFTFLLDRSPCQANVCHLFSNSGKAARVSMPSAMCWWWQN